MCLVTVISYLLQASHPELLYLLNFSCVVCLPFIALLFGEVPALELEVSRRGMVNVIFSVFFLVSLLNLIALWHCWFSIVLEKCAQKLHLCRVIKLFQVQFRINKHIFFFLEKIYSVKTTIVLFQVTKNVRSSGAQISPVLALINFSALN